MSLSQAFQNKLHAISVAFSIRRLERARGRLRKHTE